MPRSLQPQKAWEHYEDPSIDLWAPDMLYEVLGMGQQKAEL